MSNVQQASSQKLNRMGSAPIALLLLEFAIPSIVGMVVNGAYNLIDSIFLGQAVGEAGLSAITVATPVMMIFLSLALMVGSGGNALAALRLGQKEPGQAELSLGNVIFLSLVLSVAMIILAFTPAIEILLSISSATDDIRPSARVFIQIISLGALFQMIGMSVNNFIRTCGAPNRALVTMLVGAIACTIFNAWFVLGLNLGVEGSALATVCGQAISCICVMWYFIKTPSAPLKFRFVNLKPNWPMIGKILSLGMASFVIQIGFVVISLITNFLLVLWGSQSVIGSENALASIGVVQRVGMFAVLPLVGISIAMQPLLGFNYGAKLYARVKETLAYGIGMATVIGTIMFVIVHVFPHQIVSVFGIHNEQLRDFTVFALQVQLFAIPLIGFQIVCTNYFQATGQPAKSIFLALSRQGLFMIPMLFILPPTLPSILPYTTGLDAIYFAPPVSDSIAIIVTAVFMWKELKRINTLQHEQVNAN